MRTPQFSHYFARYDQLQRFFFGRIHNIHFDQYGHFKTSLTSKSSFSRTIRIMERQGLVSYQAGDNDMDFDLTLTEKGKKTAAILKKQVLKYIEDFSFLLDRKTSSTPKGTALSPT